MFKYILQRSPEWEKTQTLLCRVLQLGYGLQYSINSLNLLLPLFPIYQHSIYSYDLNMNYLDDAELAVYKHIIAVFVSHIQR